MNKPLLKTDPLTSDISLRPAAAGDERAIRAIVRGEGLNPLSLHWRNFLVAEDSQRRIVGIGAVKTHGDGSRELASIAVLPSSRGRGVATAVIRAMMAAEAGPLYLTCRDSMAGFYERFGFRAIGIGEMTPYFQRLYRIFSLATRLLPTRRRLVVMKRKI
jgi:N-acetylglutamate synthase-like GNAT family acetyltransferase